MLRDAKGYAHNAFKIDLARRAIVRALTQAARGTPQSQSQQENPVSPMTLYRHAYAPASTVMPR